ncbi:MAG: peptidoglycan recognition family protein [Nanoarchaeota archaeon]|nr:peptidoglycan recognition family protein [Nanoarchaeota archaeon]
MKIHEEKLKFYDRTYTLKTEGLRENKPEFIVMHATYSYVDFEGVLKKHKSFGWNGVGYHLFISGENSIYQGRPFNLEGSHALGFNTKSIGICFYLPKCINEKRIKTANEILSFINESDNLEVIPHTLAQIVYDNKLLRDLEVDKQFPEAIDVVSEKRFEKIKKDMSSLADILNDSKYKKINWLLRSFKNCPGPLFYNFRRY